MKNWLLDSPSFDDLLRLLRAWRFWVLGALLGGLLGAAVYLIAPPEFRARATVVVSFNMEKAWPVNSDKELFYYLERESRKVQDVAWADATLQQVADETGFSIVELRSGKLELSQPQDGGWHFYATDPQAAVAAKLASAWAGAFSAQIYQGIQTAIALDAARKSLVANPNDVKLQATISELESKSLAITPELQISSSQTKDLPAARKSGLGIYVLAGAGLLLAIGALAILLIHQKENVD
jgi:pimeloyl-ACP methyl ester carboxylesterase